MTEPVFLEPLNKAEALKFQENMDLLLGQIHEGELKLSHSYARLGARLREAELQQYWISLGHHKFSGYLLDVGKKIGRERSQMYAILSVATDLLPLISEEALEEIGITKSHELRRLVKQGGSLNAYVEVELDPKFLPPPGLDQLSPENVVNLTAVRIMDYAADPKVTAKQLRVKVNEVLHIKEDVQGFWLDLNGFYATADERKEIEQFWQWGKTYLQIKDEQPEHQWKKEVFLASVRECLGSWAEVANG